MVEGRVISHMSAQHRSSGLCYAVGEGLSNLEVNIATVSFVNKKEHSLEIYVFSFYMCAKIYFLLRLLTRVP